MTTRILVSYASKYGATAEIAEKIGQVLQAKGLNVDVLPIKQISNPAAYQAIVLGSSMYIGMWRKPAVKFLSTHQQTLAQKKVWLFAAMWV